MPRPSTITDEQILSAAREVFLEEGLQATTAEIARRAGISEGTIFRRFETKQELFFAAMGATNKPVWFDLATSLAGQGDLEENLTRLATEILDFFAIVLPKAHLVLVQSQTTRLIDIFEDPCEAPPVSALRALTKFFLIEQKAGRLQTCDPEVSARLFLGSLHHFAFCEMCGINDIVVMPRQTFVRCTVNQLLRGLRADT